jgi:hypothetical protein
MSAAPQATKAQKMTAIASVVIITALVVYALQVDSFRLLPKLVIATAAGVFSGIGFGYGHGIYDVLLRYPWRNFLSRWTRKP